MPHIHGDFLEPLHLGEITKEEYGQWRYRYPEFDMTQQWTKVHSQELSDFIVGVLRKDKLSKDKIKKSELTLKIS